MEMDDSYEYPEPPSQAEILEQLQNSIDWSAEEGDWYTKGDYKVTFTEMEQSHAQNIIKLFNRKYPAIRSPYQILYIALGGEL